MRYARAETYGVLRKTARKNKDEQAVKTPALWFRDSCCEWRRDQKNPDRHSDDDERADAVKGSADFVALGG